MNISQKRKWLSILFIALCISQASFGENLKTKSSKLSKEHLYLKQFDNKTIKRIDFIGNKRTTRKTMLTIIQTEEGDKFLSYKFIEDMRRISNTNFFYEIRYKIAEIDDENIGLVIFANDKWSLFPLLDGNVGGNSFDFKIGAFESNLLGTHMEIGGFYQNFDGESYGRIWFFDRYFLGSIVRLDINLYSSGLTDTFYNSNRDILLSLFTRNSGGSFGFTIPIVENVFTLSLGYSLYYEQIKRNSFSTINNKSEFINFQNVEQQISSYTIGMTFGAIDLLEDYYNVGQVLGISYRFSDDRLISDDSFYYLTLTGIVLYVLSDDVTMGHRLSLGKSFDSLFYRDFILGGFYNVRGFLATRFHGENIYYFNTEIRIPVYKGDVWFVPDLIISLVPFVDFGYVWDDEYFSKEMFSDFATSAGLGVRFKPRRWRVGTIRIDTAVSIHPAEFDSYSSFSLNQFF